MTILYVGGIILLCTIVNAQSAKPPGVDWKKVTFRDKTMKNQSGVTQANSADEWWFSHKNLYDNTGKLIGYIAVGYIAEVVNSADKPQIETDIQDVYNEGSDSPFNPFGSGSLFTTDAPFMPGCDELYDVMKATSSTSSSPVDAVNRRTPHRGMVARLDLQGNMVWCRIPTIHGEGLQELVQVGDYIYVVGTHYGVKSNWTLTGSRSFIPYNRTSGNTTDVFNKTTYSIPAGQTGHMYIGKYDLNGTKVWEGLYGMQNFNAPTPVQAYQVHSDGRDIVYNSSNQLLYAVGRTTGFANSLFVVGIDLNGNVIHRGLLPNTTALNTNSLSVDYTQGNSICLTNTTTGTMGVGGTVLFQGGGTDHYRGVVYSINPDLSLNNGAGAWTAANPYLFPAAPSSPQYTMGTRYDRANMIWEINTHTLTGTILVGLLDECIECGVSGNNRARGKIYRLSAQTGVPVSGYGDLGPINAYDLRIGVTETSDGGYVAVSSRRNAITFPSLSAMGVFTSCPSFTNIANAAADTWASNTETAAIKDGWAVWDTDPLIRKFDNGNNLMWEWSADIVPGRARELPPGDFKRQECMYKITETPDKSLVISGNCSFNHDDNYMVKLFPDCNANVAYTHNYSPKMNLSGTIITARKVIGIIEVTGTLTISGPTTTVKFADSRRSGVPSYILIKPGGKLILQNGATITSIDDSECPESMWDGIYVSGTSSLTQGANYNTVVNQGFLSMNSATLSNARNAITTGQVDAQGNFMWGTTGGVVYAVTSDFINNHRDVQYMHI